MSKETLFKYLIPILGIAAGFLIFTLILVFLINADPIFAFGEMLRGSLGSVSNIAKVLSKTATITFTGLAALIAFRAKYFNIGGESQLFAGAMISVLIGTTLPSNLPTPIFIIITLLVAFLMGAAVALLPAFLKVKTGANEVFTTMMLNFIVYYIYLFLITGPMRDPRSPDAQTLPIVEAAELPQLIPKTVLHFGFIFAIVAVIVIYIIFKKTLLGYNIQAAGSNVRAAQYSGINMSKMIITVAFISGGLAALAGMCEVNGVQYLVAYGFAPFPLGYGYLGIMVALTGKLNPFGTLISAFGLSILLVGGKAMTIGTNIPDGVAEMLFGVIILFVIGSYIASDRIGMRRKYG